MSLGAKIKELRVKQGKSLQQVADAIGASKAHIWDLESERSKNPSIELLKALAKCFNVSVADLIGENPTGEDQETGLVAMYRELKDLSAKDREVIQRMMDHLKTRQDDP